MTAAGEWLIDKSALARLHLSPDKAAWTERIGRGLVSICSPTVLEVGFSARSVSGWAAAVTDFPVALMPLRYITPGTERRALEVQGLLAERGQHRAASIPDLLVAAVAELHGLTILHLDKDFDLICAVTGQPAERIRAP
ncbi:MAG: PIN domain nuclease [Bifidobacteriaceae bacterium]|jgi:predicted nucleic acid-binding protein|nr:PIN domain nuclease [Bifidobacteriaceae bacterium]